MKKERLFSCPYCGSYHFWTRFVTSASVEIITKDQNGNDLRYPNYHITDQEPFDIDDEVYHCICGKEFDIQSLDEVDS